MPWLSSSKRKSNFDPPAHWIGVKVGWDEKGYLDGSDLVQLTPEELKTHAYIIGDTGSGKTNLIHHMIAQDVMQGNSIVVLDLRGDLVSATLEICAGEIPASNVRIIDLREKKRPFGFNPLSGSGEPYFRALGVLDALENENDSWGVQIAETMRNILLIFAETGESLTRIEALLHNRGFRDQLIARSKTENVIQFWMRYNEMSRDRQAALAMPVLNKVSLLLSTDTLRRILGHPNPIDLGEHLNTKGSVTLVSLAVDELHGAGRMMGNIVLSSICREIFSRVEIPENQRNPVRLYVDEFEHFGMEEFETILAEGRKFGLSLVVAHQTLAQLPTKMKAMILGIVGTKIVMRVGRDDSKNMSNDLFGDPKAFAFNAFPTGEAMLWRRNQEAIEIEVNEPIVENVGSQSELGRQFREELRRLAGESEPTPIAGSQPEPEIVAIPEKPRYVPQKPPQHRPQQNKLEDWL